MLIAGPVDHYDRFLRSSPPSRQACFDAARALNAYGSGVQITREKCFTEACRALWPGEGAVEDWAAAAFSQDNVKLSDDESDAEGETRGQQHGGLNAGNYSEGSIKSSSP